MPLCGDEQDCCRDDQQHQTYRSQRDHPNYPTLPTYDLLTASRRGALKENREMGSTLDRTPPVFPLSALMAKTGTQHRLHHFAFL
jgi:hypothetical protein